MSNNKIDSLSLLVPNRKRQGQRQPAAASVQRVRSATGYSASPDTPSNVPSEDASHETKAAEATRSAVSSKDSPTRAAIAKHLEGIAHAMVDAVNARDFDPSSEVWSNYTALFQYDFALPSREEGGSTIGLIEHLENLRARTAAHPEYKLAIVNLTVDVDMSTGRAKVHAMMEITGNPPGVVRQITGVTEYRCIKGKWLCRRYRGVQGPNVDMTNAWAS